LGWDTLVAVAQDTYDTQGNGGDVEESVIIYISKIYFGVNIPPNGRRGRVKSFWKELRNVHREGGNIEAGYWYFAEYIKLAKIPIGAITEAYGCEARRWIIWRIIRQIYKS
jgi:hypothetical protein